MLGSSLIFTPPGTHHNRYKKMASHSWTLHSLANSKNKDTSSKVQEVSYFTLFPPTLSHWHVHILAISKTYSFSNFSMENRGGHSFIHSRPSQVTGHLHKAFRLGVEEGGTTQNANSQSVADQNRKPKMLVFAIWGYHRIQRYIHLW